MATLLDIGLDLFLGLLHEILGTFVVDVDELALAIDDSVRGERFHHRLRGGFVADEPADKSVVSDFQSLETPSGAAQDGPDRRNGLADAVADRGISLRHRLHELAEGVHDLVVCLFDIFCRLTAHKDAVVLEEYHLRFGTALLAVFFDLVIDLLEKGVARVGVRNIQGVREEFGTFGGRVFRAHESVHKGRVEMDHIRPLHAVVEGCLDRGAPAFCDAGGRKVVLDLLLPEGGV